MKINRKSGLIVSFLFAMVVSYTGVYGQAASGVQDTAKLSAAIEGLKIRERANSIERKERIANYVNKTGAPVSRRDERGNLILLVDVDQTGHPIYETTDNAEAAITTGVTKLRAGSELGLNLQGEGVSVAIWDGGLVDQHIEFDNRILYAEGNLDNHATHVTGTILAKGINANAKGMAPMAQARTYSFDNDVQEMLSLVKPDATSVLLSNHSYGLISGWYFDGTWQWFGNPSVSTAEDYRFGFYSSKSRTWDQMSFNAPYYLIVKSAGNDRNKTGPGPYPANCNGGTGYDCISDAGTAKNIMTVGAVEKVLSYTGPSSVVMSSFSSWGPTDDGRIKPDIVADGVSVFSTIASATHNAYGRLSGTSMATPNVTGTLTLIQELYNNIHATFLKSSTLKGLAIHNAKEAGFSPGPDYSYGWGLLDAEAMAKTILAEDNQNTFIDERTLMQGQTYEVVLSPKPNTKMTITLSWTDPDGTPVGASLDPTKIMLVNDLDIQLVDDGGGIQYPWILDPQNVTQPATKGDNIRDNVEKIEFSDPEPRDYTLVVSHKASLVNGKQDFSLIISYESVQNTQVAYYRIGGSGNWNDPAKWSLSSGGAPVNNVPGVDNRVIIDENSFTADGQTISFTQDASVASLIWLSKRDAGMALNNHQLQLESFVITSSGFSIGDAGRILFASSRDDVNNITLKDNNLENVDFYFDGESSWNFTGTGKIRSIVHNSGNVRIATVQLELLELNSDTENERILDLSDGNLESMVSSSIDVSNLEFYSGPNSNLVFSSADDVTISWDGVSFNGHVQVSAPQSEVIGEVSFESLSLSGSMTLTDATTINHLVLEAGAELSIASTKTLHLTEEFEVNSTPSDQVTISSSGTASISFDGYYKLCFDNLNVENVGIITNTVVNVGESGSLDNAANWVQDVCENVLFPDFETKFNCEGSLTHFIDQSSGDVTQWEWNFGDGNSATTQNAYHVFEGDGTYTVTLTVSNGESTQEVSKSVVITVGNNIPVNTVVLSGLQLFSVKSGESYQWFKDNEPIPGATSRGYNFTEDPGSYFVTIDDGTCNRPSAPFDVITSVGGPEAGSNNFSIYPNPVTQGFFIDQPEKGDLGKFQVMDALGRVLEEKTIVENPMPVSLEGKAPGIYFVKIIKKNKEFRVKKLYKK